MRRRRLRWTVAGLALALAGAAAFALWPRPSRITRENYDRIEEGMSRAEVYAILGRPGDYATGPTTYRGGKAEAFDSREHAERAEWLADRACIYAYFDRAGRLSVKCLHHPDKIDQGPLDNLLWRAKRQWRKWFP